MQVYWPGMSLIPGIEVDERSVRSVQPKMKFTVLYGKPVGLRLI